MVGGEGMDLKFLRLWDIYNPLLTEHQREVTDLRAWQPLTRAFTLPPSMRRKRGSRKNLPVK